MFRRILLVSLVLLCFAGNSLALGNRENNGSRPIQVIGTVQLAGSSIMPLLILSGENREWHIDPQEQEKLHHLQHRTVTVRGREYYYDRYFANGTPAGRFYYLRDIRIITVH